MYSKNFCTILGIIFVVPITQMKVMLIPQTHLITRSPINSKNLSHTGKLCR